MSATARRAGMLAGMLLGSCVLHAYASHPGAGTTDPQGALGEIRFPTSAGSEAQAHFVRGMLLLHSFEYEDAREHFRRAQAVEPDFAMAYWGEALTHDHPLWGRQDLEAGRAVLRRLGSSPQARLAKAPTEREKGYLRAVHVLFGEGDARERHAGYARAMETHARAFPKDLEARSLHALAILGTSYGDRDVSTYMRAAAAAEEVFMRNRRHPGAIHYLIHAYDDPVHAPLGLRAARRYADLAPAAAHAQHMPSHIYLALGMWDEVVAANETAWAASDARAKRKHLPPGRRDYHSLSWLAYGYLQTGRFGDAAGLLQTMRRDAKASGSRYTRTQLVYMRATYVVETREWQSEAADMEIDVSGLDVATQATDVFVRALIALRTGEPASAEDLLGEIARRRAAADPERTWWSAELDDQTAAILERELAALLHLAAGREDEALAALREAAAAAEERSFTYGPPWPVKPPRELLGEVLLDLGRHAAAATAFRRALDAAPKRSPALLGLARAAAEAGEPRAAREAFEDLARNWRRAGERQPVLEEIAREIEARRG